MSTAQFMKVERRSNFGGDEGEGGRGARIMRGFAFPAKGAKLGRRRTFGGGEAGPGKA